MHSISLITAALAATVSAAPAQKRDLTQKGQIDMEIYNSTMGCLGPDMMWTLDGDCGVYKMTEVIAWNDQGWAWELLDLKGNNCGPIGEYQSCDPSLRKANYYSYDQAFEGLFDGAFLGYEYVTKLPEKGSDVPILSHHNNVTDPLKVLLTWHLPIESSKGKNGKTTLPHTG